MSVRTARLQMLADEKSSSGAKMTEAKLSDEAVNLTHRGSHCSGMSGPARVSLLNFSIFAALLMVISASSTISAIHSCNRGRFVMNSTWGVITNGPENYREDSYCVWLIEGLLINLFLTQCNNITEKTYFILAQHQGQYITLSFQSLQTECAYDHVFIYDGDTVDSKLKGSFSGRGLPAPVVAKSGSVSDILFYFLFYFSKHKLGF